MNDTPKEWPKNGTIPPKVSAGRGVIGGVRLSLGPGSQASQGYVIGWITQRGT